jgi:hypothetical protein
MQMIMVSRMVVSSAFSDWTEFSVMTGSARLRPAKILPDAEPPPPEKIQLKENTASYLQLI